ncbi:hypothetical protein SAMN04487968_104290 [Nocardioides terrae]|uniref:PknH-like extracellular domain-containing protein n=1 Tax=Nocardioides terrae TaxID=574651 RepID=A0A1I1HJV1_9ACTN|nr:hypothetical protein [Nocardioides terrae]SFC22228.1 hypothetical protein SAMN04487968_104290 [Nocardioides terrae]
MSNRRVVLPGVILGVFVLALAAVFAIVLPKISGESDDISLPDRLPGGYTATDLASAYKDAPGATDDKVQQASASERSTRSYGDKMLKKAGVVGVTRNYVNKDLSSPLVVQAFRAEGGAFAPFQFSDPKTAQGGNVQTLVRKGDVLCIQNGSADAQGTVQNAYVECQKSEHGLTVQVTSPLALEKAVAVVNDVFDEVA